MKNKNDFKSREGKLGKGPLRKGWTCEEDPALEIMYASKIRKNIAKVTNKETSKSLKIVTDKKILNKLKNAKIELAPTDGIDKYQKEIDIILKLLGHSEALVTDESSIWDFLYHFGSKEENDKHNEKTLSRISGRLAIDIKSNDLLIDIAKKIKNEYDCINVDKNKSILLPKKPFLPSKNKL